MKKDWKRLAFRRKGTLGRRRKSTETMYLDVGMERAVDGVGWCSGRMDEWMHAT